MGKAFMTVLMVLVLVVGIRAANTCEYSCISTRPTNSDYGEYERCNVKMIVDENWNYDSCEACSTFCDTYGKASPDYPSATTCEYTCGDDRTTDSTYNFETCTVKMIQDENWTGEGCQGCMSFCLQYLGGAPFR